MSTALRSSIDDLAHVFASSIVAAIKGASLEDILSLTGASTAPAPSTRRGRGRPRGSVSKPARAPRRVQKPTVTAAPTAQPAPAKKTAKRRLRRRSPAEIANALAAVVALVKKSPKGLRAEQIRAQLKMEAKEMPRVLKEGLAKKSLKSKGQKRSTTYSAA